MMNDLKDINKKTTDENQIKYEQHTNFHPIADNVELSDEDFAEDSCELLVGWSHNGWMNHGGGGGNW